LNAAAHDITIAAVTNRRDAAHKQPHLAGSGVRKRLPYFG
jgi:hypothetical protein